MIGSKVPPTLLFDEVDAIFGTKTKAEQHEDLRALLNAGFGRGRPALRCVGPNLTPTKFNTFAMVALAAIHRLPDTITDRAVNIDLKRRSPAETVARFRIREGKTIAGLRERLGAWVNANLKVLAEELPELPVEDREADAWEPLVSIADAAGSDWPIRARAACRALCGTAADSDEELGTKLLADIRKIFDECPQAITDGVIPSKFLASQMLVNELRAIEDAPWMDLELTKSKLAARLKPFGVPPGFNAAKTVRGYRQIEFHDAFRRYLRPGASERPETTDDQ